MMLPMTDFCSTLPSKSQQRKWIAFFWLLLVLGIFWFLSRYPDLYKEVTRADEGSLLSRHFNVLSKDEMMVSHGVEHPFYKIITLALNWLETNKFGMTFGFLFSAAFLLLIEQSQRLSQIVSTRGRKGSLYGLVFGMPLGVCTNCATPIGLGLKKSGASTEAAFSSLMASPSLNPIALLLLMMLFPFKIFLLRVFCMLFLLLYVLPLICQFFEKEVQDDVRDDKKILDDIFKERWSVALSYCFRRYFYYLGFMLKKVLPIMIMVSVLAALIAGYFPLEAYLYHAENALFITLVIGLIGLFLPMPMLVDIIFAWFLFQVGMPLYQVAVLLMVMAPVSLLVFWVMGKNISWRLTAFIFLAVYIVGLIAGLIAFYYIPNPLPSSLSEYQKKSPFTHQKYLPITKPFENDKFNNFFAGGVSLVDFNRDGYSDIFVAGNREIHLLQNQKDGSFKNVSHLIPVAKNITPTAGIWADYDNDGLLDLFLVNYQDEKDQAQKNQLFKNLGDKGFIDVSEKVGLTHRDKSSSAAFADIDNDGDLDLFVSNYGSIKMLAKGQVYGDSAFDRLYLNENGYFIDITKKAGLSGNKVVAANLATTVTEDEEIRQGFSFQPLWFDFNNDNLIDLFVTADFGSSQLYQNLGNGKFKEVTHQAGLYDYGTGMGASILDINQDGYWDIYVATGEDNKLWLNQKNGTFINLAKDYNLLDEMHIGWGTSIIDLNNSGNPQIMVANGFIKNYFGTKGDEKNPMLKVNNSNSLFFAKKNQVFSNIAHFFSLLNPVSSRGLAVADFNNDGAQDIALTHRESHHLSLYMNNHINQENHFLAVKLIGQKNQNRDGVGAKVTLIKGDRIWRQLVSAGSSFASQHAYTLHFGVGDIDILDKVIVKWPNGKEQIFSQVKTNQLLKVGSDSGIL